MPLSPIQQHRKDRDAFFNSKPVCPICLCPDLDTRGGAGTCWLECACGAYSPPAPSWQAALERKDGWEMSEPEPVDLQED